MQETDHLLLIWFVIHKYLSRIESIGLDKEEAFSRGLVGLALALKQDDPTRGYKFSTFAAMLIQQEIFYPGGQKYHKSYINRQLENIKQLIYQRSGKHITDTQLADLTGMKTRDINNTLRPTETLESVLTNITEGYDYPDYREPLPEIAADTIPEKEFVEAVQAVLNNRDVLDDKERKAVKLFFGFSPFKRRYTQREIGLLLNGNDSQNISLFLKHIFEKLSSNRKLEALYVEA